MAARLWTLLTALAWLAFCAAAYSTPLIAPVRNSPQLGLALGLQILSIAVGAGLLTGMLFVAERADWPLWSRIVMAVVGSGAVALLWQFNLKSPAWMALHALALVACALPIGYWLGTQMQRASHLVPLGIAMSMADIYSVTGGPSRVLAKAIGGYQQEAAQRVSEAVQNAPAGDSTQAVAEALRHVHAPLAAYFVVSMPLASQGQTTPLLGIGDLIALAFIFRAAWVHRLNPGLVFSAALASTLAALTLAEALHKPLPALPLICAGTLGALAVGDARLSRLDRQEMLLSIGVVLLFGALLAAKWLPR